MQPKGTTKALCPSCNKKTFVRYYDNERGEFLPNEFGRCDREIKCSYFNKPPLETLCFFVPFDLLNEYNDKAYQLIYKDKYSYLAKSQVFEIVQNGCYVSEFSLTGINAEKPPLFIEADKKYFDSDNNGYKPPIKEAPAKQLEQKKDTYIPFEILKATLKNYESNEFVNYLLERTKHPFNSEDLNKVISLYYLGTISKGYYKGAICFPFIDMQNNIKAIQVKQFDKTNHTIKTTFIHAILKNYFESKKQALPDWLNNYLDNEKKVSCFFGEYLLKKYPTNPVAIVEAPKTAIYSTLYYGFPSNPKNFIWLSSFNLSSLNLDKCKVLKGRKVLLFPDLSKDGKAFELWSNKAKKFQKELSNTKFAVSNLLERNATPEQRTKGLDLADYLINLNWAEFRNSLKQEQPAPAPSEIEVCEKCEKCESQTNLFNCESNKESQFIVQELIKNFYIENNMLMTNGYPAIFDKNQYIDIEIQNFIENAHKNPKILHKYNDNQYLMN